MSEALLRLPVPALELQCDLVREVRCPNRDIIDATIKGWNELRKLDDRTKQQYGFVCPISGEQDLGYVKRGGKIRNDKRDDVKEFFHISSRLHSTLITNNVDRKRIASLLEPGYELYAACLREMIADTERRFGSTHPKIVDRIHSADAMGRHALRIMTYVDRSPLGTIIGKGHGDRSLTTMHVAEERPGLMLRLPGSKELPVAAVDGRSFSFTGKKLAIETNMETLGVYHWIVETLDPSLAKVARWVVIFFLHTDITLPKDDDHLVYP